MHSLQIAKKEAAFELCLGNHSKKTTKKKSLIWVSIDFAYFQDDA